MAGFIRTLWGSGIVLEVILIGIVSARGVARNIPTFLAYLYWCVIGDLCLGVCYYHYPRHYTVVCGIQSVVEGFVLLIVLLDLARSAVRTLPIPVSRGALGILGLIVAAAGVMVWRITDSWALLSLHPEWHFLLREQLTLSILRILLLLLIGGLAEFLSRHQVRVGWGDRELQIATGLGIYALASLAQNLATTYQSALSQAKVAAIYLSVEAVYEVCLIYWIVCFVRPDPVCVGQTPDTPEAGSSSVPTTLWQKGDAGELEGPIVGEIAGLGRV